MVGHVSLYQLLANARIAACRVASYPSAFGPRDPQKPASTSREPLYGSRAGSAFQGIKLSPWTLQARASGGFGHENGSDR
jgi:hypothetical protein